MYKSDIHFGGPKRTKSDAFMESFRLWTTFFIPSTVAKAWELNANLDKTQQTVSWTSQIVFKSSISQLKIMMKN